MNLIRALLKDTGWSHAEMARFLGVGQPTVTRYAAVNVLPQPIERLLNALNAGLNDVRGLRAEAALQILGLAAPVPDSSSPAFSSATGDFGAPKAASPPPCDAPAPLESARRSPLNGEEHAEAAHA